MSKKKDDLELERNSEFEKENLEDEVTKNSSSDEVEDFDFGDDFDFEEDFKDSESEEFEDAEPMSDKEFEELLGGDDDEVDLSDESAVKEDVSSTSEVSEKSFEDELGDLEEFEDDDFKEEEIPETQNSEEKDIEEIELDSVNSKSSEVDESLADESKKESRKEVEKVSKTDSSSVSLGVKHLAAAGAGLALLSVLGSVALIKLIEPEYVERGNFIEVMQEKEMNIEELSNLLKLSQNKLDDLSRDNSKLETRLERSSGVDSKLTEIVNEIATKVKVLSEENANLKKSTEDLYGKSQLVMGTSTKMIDRMNAINEKRSSQIEEISKQIEILKNNDLELTEAAMNSSKSQFEVKQLAEKVASLQAAQTTSNKQLERLSSNLTTKNRQSTSNKGLDVPVKVVVDKTPKFKYGFVGVVDGTLFVRDSRDSIDSFELGDEIPGYGKIQSIKTNGDVETDKGKLEYTL